MLKLRVPDVNELHALSLLCLRSKAYWGYDEDFMEACREVLTITSEDLNRDQVWIAEGADGVIGVLQVQACAKVTVLDKLFVDPNYMGLGAGRFLFEKAKAIARGYEPTIMTIDADPGAESFYTKMGAVTVDRVPSTVIEGRMLPFMHYDLST